LFAAAPVSADVVELRNGQRLEGTFKGADETAVRIEVGGRVMTFAPGEVRAIYYGPPPVFAPAPIAELRAALAALVTLRSVAQPGVAYRDYLSQVRVAQTTVDRYLQKEEGAPAIKGTIADAMHLYALAGTAWTASTSRGNYAEVGSDAALTRCEPA